MFESFNALVNAPMSEHTTLRLGGPADYLVFPRSAGEISAMFDEAGAYNMPVTVIGHGSNLLVLDGGIRGAVIRMARGMSRCFVLDQHLIADAGAMMGAAAGALNAAAFGPMEGDISRKTVARMIADNA